MTIDVVKPDFPSSLRSLHCAPGALSALIGRTSWSVLNSDVNKPIRQLPDWATTISPFQGFGHCLDICQTPLVQSLDSGSPLPLRPEWNDRWGFCVNTINDYLMTINDYKWPLDWTAIFSPGNNQKIHNWMTIKWLPITIVFNCHLQPPPQSFNQPINQSSTLPFTDYKWQQMTT